MLREHINTATMRDLLEYAYLAGDWNFASSCGGQRRRQRDAETEHGRNTSMQRAWKTVRRHTTEIAHDHPTRAVAIHVDGDDAITMSSIDRLYPTIPQHVLAEVAATVEVGRISTTLWTKRRAPMSYHTSVRATLRLRPPLPPNTDMGHSTPRICARSGTAHQRPAARRATPTRRAATHEAGHTRRSSYDARHVHTSTPDDGSSCDAAWAPARTGDDARRRGDAQKRCAVMAGCTTLCDARRRHDDRTRPTRRHH